MPTHHDREPAIRAPGISLSFLLVECGALFAAPAGAAVTFSDRSRAMLRTEGDSGSEVLVLSHLEIAGGSECRLVVLQGEGSLALFEVGPAVRIEFDRARIESSPDPWILRLVKTPSGLPTMTRLGPAQE